MLSERDGVMLPVSTPDAYYRFVGEEIDRLKSDLGIRSMVVLGSVPTASGVGSPMDCFGRPFLDEPSCMSHPRTNPVVMQREKTNELLREHLPQSVTFVDPFGALCGPTDCSIISDGPLYSDSTHLSGLGSKTVMASIALTIRHQLSRDHTENASK